MTEQSQNTEKVEGEKSFFGIIVHSFFIIPFLIAVFCLLLFTAVKMLTREQRTAHDYLQDVRTGGITKRWQAAFELSKMLGDVNLIPEDQRFKGELINAFRKSLHDDYRVRQYLALAMGRMGGEEFFEPLTEHLADEDTETLYAIIYALGMLKDSRAVNVIGRYLDHDNPRIRSVSAVALGNIGDENAKNFLKKSLLDNEPNVQWGSALSLARFNDHSGKKIIGDLLSRSYLEGFEAVDPQEQTQLMIAAVYAAGMLKDANLLKQVEQLSKTDENMKVRAAALEVLNQ